MKQWSYDLPHISPKQKEILKLIYKFRFLDRIQIQILMKHKDYKRINVWLKDLAKKVTSIEYMREKYLLIFSQLFIFLHRPESGLLDGI